MKTDYPFNSYRPLPQGLTIGQSKIHGLGVFATKDWSAATHLGRTHIADTRNDWIRTPLGGFINHSEEPNAFILNGRIHRELYTIKPIKKGDEIVVYYTLQTA